MCPIACWNMNRELRRSSFDMFRTVRNNFGWLMMDRLGRSLISLVVGIAVARHLGPENFGVLSFAIALSGIFMVMASLGLDEILVRDFADNSIASAVWKAAWQLRLTTAAIGYLATMTTVWIWRPASPEVWGIAAIVAAGMTFAPCDLVDYWFQAKQQMRIPAMARQLSLWLAAGWRLLLVAVDAPLSAFAWANLAEAALVGFALWLALRRTDKTVSFDGKVAGHRSRLLREGWPLAISSLLVIVTMQADRLLLSRYGGDAAVGIYSAAARLTEVLHALPVALGVALMPHLVALYREDRIGYWRLAGRVMGGLTMFGIVFAGAVTLLAPIFLPWLLGKDYADSAQVLGLHIWTLVFVFMVSMRSRFLVIQGSTRWIFFMSFPTALLNVLANLVLIPRYGGIGAAWAAVGAWGFSALVVPWFFPITRSLAVNIIGGGKSGLGSTQ